MNFTTKSFWVTLIAVAVISGLTLCPVFSQAKSWLHEAATKGDLATMQKLLAEGADVNGRDETGITPLMAAAANGQIAAIKLLLKSGAEVNAKTEVESFKGYNALIATIVEGRTEAAKLLITQGADINTKFSGRWSPLVIASVAGQTQIVDLLRQQGADNTNLAQDIAELTKKKANTVQAGNRAQQEHLQAELKQAYAAAQIYFLDHPGTIIDKQAQLAEAGWTSRPKDIVFIRADISEASGGIVLRNRKLDDTNSSAAKDLGAGEGMVNFTGEVYLPSLK